MKIYMITDMEGVGGVINESHVFSDRPYYEKAREWLTLDVNAAVQGAIEGGADEVLVCDGHGANSACNMLYEKLHEGARYIQGTPWKEYLAPCPRRIKAVQGFRFKVQSCGTADSLNLEL